MSTSGVVSFAIIIGVAAYLMSGETKSPPAAAIASAPPVADQPPNKAFKQMVADTGCASKYTDEKKAHIFATQWKGVRMTVAGEIARASKGEIQVRLMRDTLIADVAVTLTDRNATFNLEREQYVIVSFDVTGHGGCVFKYRGNNGVIASVN